MSNEWTIVYHGGPKPEFKGRAEFLRLILEDAGVKYGVTGDNLYGPTGWMDAFRGKMDSGLTIDAVIAANDSPYPAFAPPAIWHQPAEGESVFVTQTAACVAYIGTKLGYCCGSDAERARADNILMNAMDFISEGRSSFHPVDNTASYTTQKEEGDRASKKWSEGRMLQWSACLSSRVPV